MKDIIKAQPFELTILGIFIPKSSFLVRPTSFTELILTL